MRSQDCMLVMVSEQLIKHACCNEAATALHPTHIQKLHCHNLSTCVTGNALVKKKSYHKMQHANMSADQLMSGLDLQYLQEQSLARNMSLV